MPLNFYRSQCWRCWLGCHCRIFLREGDATRDKAQTKPQENCSGLVAETNTERTRSANEIAVGRHGFDLAYGVTDFSRADLWSGERNHFSELTGSNQFNGRRSEHRAQCAIKRRRRSASLKMAEHTHA